MSQHDNAKTTLHSAGLRVTASRLAVLGLLSRARRPLCHLDVVSALSDEPWNRSTLYRNLIDLTDAGIARKTQVNGIARFERVGSDNSCVEHPHFVCTSCSEIQHLDGARVIVEGRGLPAAIVAGEIEAQLRGVCDRCRG